jgi:nicotinamide-nucleotide adenylyltransferase
MSPIIYNQVLLFAGHLCSVMNTMCRRALFVFDWPKIAEATLDFIEKKSILCDELIFIIDRADELPLCGDLITKLQSLFSKRLKKPFYLLPMLCKGLPNHYYWMRWRFLAPLFQIVYTDQVVNQSLLHKVLHTPIEVFESQQDNLFLNFNDCLSAKRRGLFITRAQPFHLGHVALLNAMKQDVDELIFLVAMANQSHTMNNIATSGERLEMCLPWLNKVWPGRYFLVALPYSDFSMENFLELEFLLPKFDKVHTSNPNVAVLAESAGLSTQFYPIQNKIRGSLIRDCFRQDRPFEEYVPESTLLLLAKAKIPQRLRALSGVET